MNYIRIFFILVLGISVTMLKAQDDIYPANPQTEKITLIHATIHVGNGIVLNNATLEFDQGKIVSVKPDFTPETNTGKTIDCTDKQVYPGLILTDSDLGLKEFGSGVAGADDDKELGSENSELRAITAYDANSMIIGTLRANGILLASISPRSVQEGNAGSPDVLFTGLSSVVQLDAWNWKDAAYKTDIALHVYLIREDGRRYFSLKKQVPADANAQEAIRKDAEQFKTVENFFQEAKSYLSIKIHQHHNLQFEAIKGLFTGNQKLFVHADKVRQIQEAIKLKKEFGLDVVIIGGTESWKLSNELQENAIPVVLRESHILPENPDEDVDQPYKTPYELKQAGVLFAINDTHEETRYRNLSYNAGTAAAYGLSKEQALQAITLDAAKILGIEAQTGSLEKGKDANIIITEGDILDPKSSKVLQAFIQGRTVSLENKQTQLYDRYIHKYGLKGSSH